MPTRRRQVREAIQGLYALWQMVRVTQQVIYKMAREPTMEEVFTDIQRKFAEPGATLFGVPVGAQYREVERCPTCGAPKPLERDATGRPDAA